MKVAQLRVFELNVEGLNSELRCLANRLMYLQLRTRLGKEKGRRNLLPAAFRIVAPTVDNIRNFFTPTEGMLCYLPGVARSALIR